MEKTGLKIQKEIYSNLKERAFSYEGRPSQLLQTYRDDHNFYSQRDFSISNLSTMLKQITRAQVTYLGDFHTYDQNPRNFLRIIRTLVSNQRPFKIGLEMIHYQDTHLIDAFLNDHITELEFLESIHYHDSWRFPWNHYKILFDEARKYQIPVIGLNSRGNLEKRDQKAAEIIQDNLTRDPNSLFLILFGELHLSPNRLPQKVQEATTDIKIEQVIIHQNLDEVYWKLEPELTGNEVNVVQFNKGEFCLISSPPWLKYESMCYWYESLMDDPEYDIHNYIIEKGAKTFNYSTHENFQSLFLSLTFQLKLQHQQIDQDFNLYDHTRLSYLSDKIGQYQNPSLQSYLQSLLKSNKSFVIPDSNILYCGNYSLNKMAKLAGKFYFQKQLNFSIQELLSSPDNKKIFLFLIMNHFFSYLFAKVLNPHLKCDLYQDLLQRRNWPTHEEAHSAKIALQTFQELAYPDDENSLILFHHSAKFIAEILAENFYHSLSALPTVLPTFLDIQNLELKNLFSLILKDQNYTKQKKRTF